MAVLKPGKPAENPESYKLYNPGMIFIKFKLSTFWEYFVAKKVNIINNYKYIIILIKLFVIVNKIRKKLDFNGHHGQDQMSTDNIFKLSIRNCFKTL